MGSGSSKIRAISTKSPDILFDELQNKDKILLVSIDGSIIKVNCFSYGALKSKQDDIKILSYRCGNAATQYRKCLNWKEALIQIAMTGSYSVPTPLALDQPLALKFHQDLLHIFRRTKIKFLWIDQLCIPQETSKTINIIQTSGSFYKEFDVLVWVPWITKTDTELQIYKNKIKEAEDSRNDKYLVMVIGDDILSFYHQTLRGWIQREMSSSCKAMEYENKRNIDFLRFVYNLLDDSTLKRQEHKVDRDTMILFQQLKKICQMTYTLWNCLKGMIGERFPESHILVQEAARLTVAPFTISSDREIVASLESYINVVLVTAYPKEEKITDFDTLSDTSSSSSGSNCCCKEQMILRMFTYLGTMAFERGILFKDWPGYNYDQRSSKRLIDYFVTIVQQSFVYYSEAQFIEMNNLLRTGTFNAYLPEDCCTLVDTAKFTKEEQECYIYINSNRCVLMYAKLDIEQKVKSPWGNKYPTVDEALIQAGNLQLLLDALESISNGCCVGGRFINVG